MPISSVIKLLTRRQSAPRKDDRAARGRFGEQQAEKFLKKAGFKIIARNWRKGQDEIDLVCLDGDCLVFVEARARDESALVSGVDTLTQRKKSALQRVCRAYLGGLREKPLQIRFDVVEVSLCQDGNFDLHHYHNIPLNIH